MKQYPLVESLGVLILRDAYDEYVQVENLEASLQKLPKIYGYSGSEKIWWGDSKQNGDTHEARLLGVTEIKKEPVKICREYPADYEGDTINVPIDISFKKFKVTFEEIP